MNSKDEQRSRPDRRRVPRGGRRDGDRDGYAPLVLIVDDDKERGAWCEAVLFKLKFAVAPVGSAAEALRVMSAIRPNIIVAHVNDEQALREGIADNPHNASVPIVAITDVRHDPDAMIKEIRRVLRAKAVGPHLV